jgi:hypothetical protein
MCAVKEMLSPVPLQTTLQSRALIAIQGVWIPSDEALRITDAVSPVVLFV